MKRSLFFLILISCILFSQNISNDLKIAIENIKSENPVKRAYGAYKIGRLTEDIKEAIPYLINILEDERPVVDNIIGKTSPSNEAKKVLVKTGSQALPYLFEKFNDEKTLKSLKIKIIEILGEINDETSIIFLEKIANEKDFDFKEKAIEILSLNKNETDFLINYYKTADNFTKIKIIYSFGKTKNSQVLPFLYEILNDKNWEIKKFALWSIGEIKNVDDITPIIKLLKDKEYLVRKEAVETLGKIKSPVSIPYLIELLEDSNWLVRQAAIKALREIKDERALEPIINALYDKQIEVKIEAIKTLSIFKNKKATISLIICLNDKNPIIKEYSAYALGEIRDKRAIYPLINLLSDKNIEVRKTAFESLRKITGVNLGYEKEKWYKWAAENKVSTITEN
ncbi:MAG: HEAT repeat domain-containing protein [Candidatus Omnitrophica bacterium]|nr:HEAT repeat domain-containing protein [Candidatus Omnitrophota bacterium]